MRLSVLASGSGGNACVVSARWECAIFTTAGTADAIGLEGNLFSPFVRVEAGREGRVSDLGFRAFATPPTSRSH